jgi:type 1 glutamine amidotransferase
MKTLLKPNAAFGLVLAALLTALSAPAAEKIRVLWVVGGHDFQTNQFHQMLQANAEITYEMVQHPNAQARWQPANAGQYDVLLFYDMWQNITDEAKTNLLNWLKAGKGLVVLHHAMANYQKWPEYEQIIGGRYYLQKTLVNGVEKAQSVYKHDVRFKVKIADPNHPITRGLQDFDIRDETYGRYEVQPQSQVLLTTDEPTSTPKIGWIKNYGTARVVYLQLGHDHFAYENPHYRRLLAQAIRWSANP